MPYTPVTVEKFGGLQLSDPSAVGWSAAADLANVDVLGDRVRTRRGYTLHSSINASFPIVLAARHSPYTFVHSADLGWEIIADSDGSTLTSAANTKDTNSFTRGRGGVSYFLSGAWDIFSFNGVTAAAVAGLSAYDAAMLEWWGERLAFADVTAAGRIRFTEPGGTTILAGDFVDLDYGEAGGGEFDGIRGLATFGGELYVFGSDRFHIFYGISVDATGGAIFNYRTVYGHGIPRSNLSSACTADETGVYFPDNDGIYRTTGGPAVRISDDIAPIFDTSGTLDMPGAFTGDRFPVVGSAGASVYLHAKDGLLFCCYGNTANGFSTLVRSRGGWSYYDWGATAIALADYGASTTQPDQFAYLGVGGHLMRSESDHTTDNGTAIASKYQAGFQSLAKGLPATIRRFELTGSGTVTHTLYGDHSTAAEWQGTAASSVVMGTAPVVAKAYGLQSGRARDLAFKVSATSGAWSLSRWTGLISAVRSY